jgi:hypothetical protein
VRVLVKKGRSKSVWQDKKEWSAFPMLGTLQCGVNTSVPVSKNYLEMEIVIARKTDSLHPA